MYPSTPYKTTVPALLPDPLGGDAMGRMLVVLGQEPHDGEVIDTASAFAQAGIPWHAMLPVPLPARVHCPWGVSAEDALTEDHEARRNDAQAHLAMLRRQAQRVHAAVTCESAECADDRLEVAVLKRSRMAGLLVTAAPPEDDVEMPLSSRWFIRLLTESGRPVLVVPRRASLDHPPRLALVAWRDTPQAARALHEALRWLPIACTLRIVVASDPGETRTACVGSDGAIDLLAHVQRHGRAATFEVVDSQGRPPEDVLLDEVSRLDADLIVMGAYGHSHALEFAFGGVTFNLMHRSRVPLFMAH